LTKEKVRTKSEEIAIAAAKEAIDEYVAREKANRKKQVFQNTNVLLEHYLDLKAYCDKAVYTGTVQTEDIIDIQYIDGDEDFIRDLEKEEITVKSIMVSREVTKIYITHVDTALETLKSKCYAKDIYDKYRAVDMLHLDPELQTVPWSERISLVADKLNCADTTVRRWRNEMVKELSVFLFGVDGLKLII